MSVDYGSVLVALTDNGNRMMKMMRKLSFLMDEAVWQFALVMIMLRPERRSPG